MRLLHRLLCRVGLHSISTAIYWEPSMAAPRVTQALFHTSCRFCAWEHLLCSHYALTTGRRVPCTCTRAQQATFIEEHSLGRWWAGDAPTRNPQHAGDAPCTAPPP